MIDSSDCLWKTSCLLFCQKCAEFEQAIYMKFYCMKQQRKGDKVSQYRAKEWNKSEKCKTNYY